MTMNKIIRLLYLSALLAILAGCNKYVTFQDYYVAFDTDISSATAINELGEFQGAYYVHYCGVLLTETFEVQYSVILGDGLKEGLDYEIVNGSGKLSFLPGIYNIPIRINWLSHEIDDSKDNTIVIRLEGCSNGDIQIGCPGPDRKGAELNIRKYKN